MDIEYIRELYFQYVQPYLGTIVKLLIIGLIAIILMRILVPIIWENILVGIIKISDKKTENEKEDEK